MIERDPFWARLWILALLIGCLLAWPASSPAEDQGGGEGSDGDGEQGEDEGDSGDDSILGFYGKGEPKFGRYGRWLRTQEKMAMGLDMWGGSATVPQGYLVCMLGWGTQRPEGRFDQNRKQTELLPVLSFEDPFHYGGKFFEFDFNVSGKAYGYMAAAMYGITDRLTVGATTMFMQTEIKIDPIFKPGTSDRLGVASLEDFYDILEQLGRPRPKHTYKSDPVDWGDTTIDVMWNYYRSQYFSTGVTGKVYLPTAHQADPNTNLIFGLGPDIDTGVATWGLGGNIPIDFRFPKPVQMVSFSFGGEGAYFLASKRKSPTFLPINNDVRDWLEAQGVDTDLFQDLTDLDDKYTFQPGPWMAVYGGIGVGPIGIQYRHGWGFEAKYKSNSAGFDELIDYIGLVGNNDDGKLTFSMSLPLTPLYIPALAQLRMAYQTDGRNALIWRDAYQVGLGFFVPLAPPDRYKAGGGVK